MVNKEAKILLLLSLCLLQSCGDDDPISAIACNWDDPFFCADEGDIKFKNTSTTRTIVEIYLVEGCASGWGARRSVSIGPTSSITYTLDSEEKHDVKAVWEDNSCGIVRGFEAGHGGEKTVNLTRQDSCDAVATSC